MPIVIAEKQINAKTIRRAVARMIAEVQPLLLEMVVCRAEPPLDDPTISLEGLDLDIPL